MMEKDGKSYFTVKKIDFDLRTACRAPFCCSKYTTDAKIRALSLFTDLSKILTKGILMNQIHFYYYILLLFAYSGEYISEVLVQVKIRHTLSGNNKLYQNTSKTDL